MIGSLLIVTAFAAYIAATVMFSFCKRSFTLKCTTQAWSSHPDDTPMITDKASLDVHPGAESDENEVLPNEALVVAVAGCILGILGMRSQVIEL